LPVQLTDAQASEDFKPDTPPAWWPEERLTAWLVGDKIAFDGRFLRSPERENQTHVRLDPHTGTADDGDLFTTAALLLTHLHRYGASSEKTRSSRFTAITLAARVRAQAWCGETAAELDTLHPLGGERRLVHWKAAAETSGWSAPQRIREALATASRVRMVLVTPAVFREGWKPAWLNDALVGTPPGATVTLRLVGMSIQRWRAVSGWSLANLPGQARGPKPVKRIVPSGGVYFFETIDGTSASLADRWLEPISDDEQDRRDGFGLAAWGIW
jgi:CRISPR-associated protein Cmr3